ncbi:MAG: hypothetical protein RMM98_16920 [Acidobacteriota bacterium]|nr:hypothetical protein [Blastocatellia bacterium]MDW8241285.1 hypothetical protein [Acidobacteriota bacterium]
MKSLDVIRKITAPFITHGIYRSDEEVLQCLAEDYVERQVEHYRERIERLRNTYQMDLGAFTVAVQALYAGSGQILALQHLPRAQQLMRAEDDLEEWQAAEEHLKRWQAIQAELRHAAKA